MQTKLPIRIVAAILLVTLFVWWLASGEDTDEISANDTVAVDSSVSGLVSAVQPIADSDVADSARGVIDSAHSAEQGSVITRLARSHTPELQAAFSNATRAIVAGELQKAKAAFAELIKSNPNLTEAYVNLAAVHARQGNLNEARSVLVQGIDANPAYTSVFGSLQKLHSTMAAKAYQLALSEEKELDDTVAAVELPLITQLSISEPEPAIDEGILKRLQKAEQEVLAARNQVSNYQTQLASLQSDNQALRSANSEIGSLREQVSRNQQLAETSSAQGQSAKVELDNLRERLAKAEQQVLDLQRSNAAEVAALQQKLDSQNALIASARSNQAEAARQAKAQQEAKERAQQAELAAANRARQNQQLKRSQAIAVVQSWAKAWSDQNVAAYISHYRDGYTPPNSSISHQTWRDQRRIRLTNKPFIEVNLKDFRVRESGQQMSVTFSQHYRSNTLNDTIVKRLVLQSKDGDWSQAKIVSESVIRS